MNGIGASRFRPLAVCQELRGSRIGLPLSDLFGGGATFQTSLLGWFQKVFSSEPFCLVDRCIIGNALVVPEPEVPAADQTHECPEAVTLQAGLCDECAEGRDSGHGPKHEPCGFIVLRDRSPTSVQQLCIEQQHLVEVQVRQQAHITEQSRFARLLRDVRDRLGKLSLAPNQWLDSVGNALAVSPSDYEIEEMIAKIAIEVAPFEQNLFMQVQGVWVGGEAERVVELHVAFGSDHTALAITEHDETGEVVPR